jgi:PIN domain nuclease of toxin-antitoxin system
VKILLDTHAFLWWATDDPRLSATARAAIGDAANNVLVSAACAWEVATKHRLGKLGEAAGAVARFGELVTADGFEHLSVTYLHALRAGSYFLTTTRSYCNFWCTAQRWRGGVSC